MDVPLRCNTLKCRTPLTDHAVVTTCSHLFCIPCADRLGLTRPQPQHHHQHQQRLTTRVCPACDTQLLNPDDAVLAPLNPTEDYKTSVLSGLSPSVMMECVGRGLAFWVYQVGQEM